MSKYRTETGIECTEEECKLIDSFKRLAKKMEERWKTIMDIFSKRNITCNDAWRYKL